MPRKKDPDNRGRLLEACLSAFVRAGTLDLSLDTLAKAAKSSKRMLIHYFGSREALEEMAMARLEDGLRARFRAGAFRAGTPLSAVVSTLWRSTYCAPIERRTSRQHGSDAAELEWIGARQAFL